MPTPTNGRKKSRTSGLVPSRYTFRVSSGDWVVLYNAASGAVIILSGQDAPMLGSALTGPRSRIALRLLRASILADLVEGGFLVPVECDEVQGVRDRFWAARRNTPMVLTITTTMECNLGCYYCYEERSGRRLKSVDVQGVVALAEERLKENGGDSLHVDWYGGEPLLNIEFLEAASLALQASAEQLGVSYSASVISNGTEWPSEIASFIATHKIRQVQISFDGLKRNHDRRRRYRDAGARQSGASSFDKAVALVEQLLDCVRVDIRVNIDRGNQADVLPFITFIQKRGWFERAFPAVVQPARLSAFSDRSAFMRSHELGAGEFDEIRASVRSRVADLTQVEEAEIPDGVPSPRSSVCAALAKASVVIGADGEQYRCGLQVGEAGRSVGSIRVGGGGSQSMRSSLPVLSSDASWWESFDPTVLPTCGRCSFLPICWAGCPKKHLEGDSHAIAEQGAYWRANLPRLIGAAVGVEVSQETRFGESDQFR